MGNSLMMHPLLLAERFGTRDYGRIYSTSQLVTVMGVAGCPPLIGLLYEASGGYTHALPDGRRDCRWPASPCSASSGRRGAEVELAVTPRGFTSRIGA